jgi:hypothetical protein
LPLATKSWLKIRTLPRASIFLIFELFSCSLFLSEALKESLLEEFKFLELLPKFASSDSES